ncbi:IclR family transcriptional regulator [Actinophytocola glycyrrhizae]|uniref:IclR family transcriptional regulator n=1 Tax=Actinophytocola glycyrrhizae TaxID=2044873 RepID=A0ABV9SA50_9PSEU
MAGNSARPGTSVVSRVLAVLGAFDDEHRAMTLTELAARADLPLTTAFRLVGELVAWGALVRRESGAYVIGRRLWDLGLLAPVPSGLRQVASPFLHDLYGATLATVHLAVRDGASVLYIDRLAGHVSVPVVSDVGSRLPMHATGVGKVLLAHAPDDVRGQVLRNLTRITPYTVTQPGRLRAELRRVHREGYAQTIEEMSLGACSVAVPISVRDGAVVAALGIVVPRLGRDRPRLVAALRVAAKGVGRSVDPARISVEFH